MDQHKKAGRPPKYGFDQMKKGERRSFQSEDGKAVARAAHAFGVRHGWKFRTVSAMGCTIVWRVE